MNNARNTAPDLGKFHGRRIAVTGATGMLGSHLVAELLRAGYTDITLPVRDAARIAVTEAALRRLGVHAPEGALKIIETPLTTPSGWTKRYGTSIRYSTVRRVSCRAT